ncbi:MAG: tRNA guanosine(34) transglycosylase Tgt [Patescibacteria group bacterium]|nr:tRNA guanosine(34) transglycosylase Tgt [Patescibacteria group bacterium]
MSFKLLKKSKKSQARIGILKTQHGKIQTPFFMPIATVGTVKTLTFEDLHNLPAQIILSNTYHLMLRPGEDLIKKAGGLHRFINWHKPILTDSGGFQVFSLSKLRKIDDRGIKFNSHIDGREYFLTPLKALKIQQKLGVDIVMLLDECVGLPASREKVAKAVERTTKWAKQQQNYIATLRDDYKKLFFGIVQGGVYKDLRLKSTKEITALNFDGYAVGGLAVGESEKEMYQVLDWVCPKLPSNKPHYLMGVGYPEQIIEAVKKGIDMFDCVIPTREARHGKLYQFKNKKLDKGFYQTINISNAKFKKDFSPINPDSKLEILRKYSKSYLHHLFKIQEPLALRLATLNNVEFYLNLMERIRRAIKENNL